MPYADDGKDVPKYVTGSDKHRRQWSHVWNSEYHRQKGKGKSDKEAEQIAFAAANSVAGSKKMAKLLQKSAADDTEAYFEALITAIEKEFATLPAELRAPLEAATLSGVGQGLLQIDVNSPKVLSSANQVAQQYAADRAAELVGMKYDAEGNLIPNPNAKWAISDTTREKIREIITESFTEDTPMAEIKTAIQDALREEASGNGIFSAGRAALIARTEVMRAQVGGNFDVWEKSGVVKSIRWLTAEDEKVCLECDGNDNVVVEIGKPFPSGDKMPGVHPLCRCVVVVNEVSS